MRKLVLFCTLAILISGCSNNKIKENDFQYTYNSFVNSILESSGEYRYAITIDDARIAMYNIQMMVVDKSASGQYPFIGLMNDEPEYSMIPNQENKENNFVKGIVLEGLSATPKFTLLIQVSWKDYAQVNTRSVFFSYVYDYDRDHKDSPSDQKENNGDQTVDKEDQKDDEKR